MPKQRNKFIDYLAYLAFRVFETFVLMFDVRANYRTFALLGDLIYRLDRRHRRRATEHLRLSFPHWPAERCDRVAREALRSFCFVAMETIFSPRLITPTRWQKHVRLANMAENMRLLLRHETPLVFVTGHFGNWEIVGYAMSVLGFPIYAVGRPLDNPYLSDYLTGIRQRSGLTMLDKKGVTAHVDDILSGKGALGWIADQDAGRKGLFVDFFGRPASTYKSIGLLAMRYEAPIVVGYGRRLDRHFHFEIGIRRIIHPHEWAGKDDPLLWITQEYTAALEELIRGSPEQYLWSHRRWKHRPRGQEPGPDGIA